jgi:isoamylase
MKHQKSQPAPVDRAAIDDGTKSALKTVSLVGIKSLAGKQEAPQPPEAVQPWKAVLSGRNVSAGSPAVLGATLTARGVNFALASNQATEVFLELFDSPEAAAVETIQLTARTGEVWHAEVEGLKAGQLYGYRVNGPFDPKQGLRFNPHKLLMDPYAKAFAGKYDNRENILLAYDSLAEGKDLTLDKRDSAAGVPKGIVCDDAFDWDGDVRPGIPDEKRVVYEVHLKGFTAHPSSGVAQAGTYLGFIEKIPYLKELGVNAVELLPVHEFMIEDFLRDKGLANYWGYNTSGFFAPASVYAADRAHGSAVAEFKTLVKALHKAGIEVILDVVYNHTAEGNECGPTLSFKGLNNTGYYSLCGEEDAPLRYYRNYSGTGNTLNAASPQVQRLVLDSLRYWAGTMHVDGFRFDLAACLGRDHNGSFSACDHLLGAIAGDPLLRKLKLIAEPWDMEAYEVGSLSPPWSEWNGKFRDAFRRFAKGDPGQVKEISSRLAGSPDLFGHNERRPSDSVNFLTCHDGFTLYDLVAYNDKHNEANGENNQDGSNDNASWNCGAEGETDDEGINALRRQQAKNLFCHQLLSIGTPMITAGDEFLRTQGGNNNVYAQDNPIAWLDWDRCKANPDMLGFVKALLRFRDRHAVLQRSGFLVGEDRSGDGIADVHWFGPGEGDVHWDDPELRCLGFQLDGNEAERGTPEEKDYRLFVVFNADPHPQPFKLPGLGEGRQWHRVIDTSMGPGEDIKDDGAEVPFPEPEYLVSPRSCLVLKSKRV